jgi:hypothetical protein
LGGEKWAGKMTPSPVKKNPTEKNPAANKPTEIFSFQTFTERVNRHREGGRSLYNINILILILILIVEI